MQPHSSAHLLQMHAGTGVVVVHVQVWHHRPQDGPHMFHKMNLGAQVRKNTEKKRACKPANIVILFS